LSRTPVRRWQLALSLVGLLALACAAAALAATAHRGASSTLVVDNSFTLKTSDPQRGFDPTASIIDRGIYDTLFTYNKGDLAHPVPLLVSSWKASNGAKKFTFNLKTNVHFANGDPLTSADVVFSLNRMINLKGNPAFLLAGTVIRSHGRYQVVMTSKTPAGQLPAILANPSASIVNSKLVKQHGGTASVGADKNDKAESWLNSSGSVGAGSGPYVLSAYSGTSQITLKRNTKYWGATKPAFDTVVVRNMVAATQLINVGRGSHEVAIDLSSDQAQTLKSNSHVKVALQPSTWVFWLFANNDPSVSAVTSNKQWQNAIRYGLDYKSILSIAGPGAYQTPGIIPSMFDGALPAKEAVKQDLTKAKQALAASGHSGDSVTLGYPSDLTINGVPFATLAQRVQSNLQAVGINVQLSGSPTGTWLTDYRSGKMAFGLSLWGPDYPDPADYLTFAPGDLVGLRVGWTKGASPAIEKTAAAAAVATDTKQRTTLFQKFQRQLNATGPYFPLMQPTQVFVATSDLKNAVYNAVYSVDVTKLAPK
jgi:peptide/nickel transport system substrate-binding protein